MHFPPKRLQLCSFTPVLVLIAKEFFFAFISIFEMLDRIVQSYARSLNHRDATKTHFIKFILDSRTMHAV